MGLTDILGAFFLLTGIGVWAGWVSFCVARGWKRGWNDSGEGVSEKGQGA